MAYFTDITLTLASPAEETVTSEGVPVYKFKTFHLGTEPETKTLLMVNKETPQAEFLKKLSEETLKGKMPRVLVTGIIQFSPCVQSKDKSKIIEEPMLTVYAGAVRRIRADQKIDPEQAIVFGNGYAKPIQDFNDKTKRKAELFVETSNQSLVEENEWSARAHLLGDTVTGTDKLCLETEEGREVYFMSYLTRSKGVMNDKEYDKHKLIATFIEETDRVRTRKTGRKTKPVSMDSQLGESFEEPGDDQVDSSLADKLREKLKGF